MRRLVLVILVFPALAAAAEREVAVLDDPAGDDRGGGALVYPQRAGFEPGDLDLRALRIVRAGEKYRFEATFARPVRDPASVAGDVGPEPLANFARRGFYAFNLDLYLDQDRVKGSGNTWALPGRGVTIDEAHAWEKAVVLTPRPELMRRQLIAALAEAEGARGTDDATRRIDAAILFATDVRVRKRTIAFEVPAAFLDGGRSDSDWSLTAFVTGARTSIEADLQLSPAPSTALERLPLGTMQPRPGRPRDTFGYEGADTPAPVVDLLAPPALSQRELLARATPLPGVTWSAAGATPAAGQGTPITRLAAAPPRLPEAKATPENDVAQRLRKLDELRAQGLISEAEHRQLRRKILSEL